MADQTGFIRIRGARTHNLHSLNLDLPRGRLIAVTGPSGSGKSSLAFDTLHAEGQRRFLLTLPGEERALFDQLKRPDVDRIEGLPPTLSVSQHVSAARPRSTLGTITEIDDHLRLLWARLGTPHCSACGDPIRKVNSADILAAFYKMGEGRKVFLLAPLVRNQVGEHREAFVQIRQGGFLRARIDDVLNEIRDIPKLPPKEPHSIEVVIDRLVVRPGMDDRFRESLATALKVGQGRVVLTHIDEGDWEDRAFSTQLECLRCDRLYPDLEPRLFSFNTPVGACPRCDGLGVVRQLDPAQVIPDRGKTLGEVLARLVEAFPDALEVFAVDRKSLKQLPTRFPKEGATWDTELPLRDWPEEAVAAVFFGEDRLFRGLTPPGAPEEEEEDVSWEDYLAPLLTNVVCPECDGARLGALARAVTLHGQSLPALTRRPVDAGHAWFQELQTPANRAALVEESATREKVCDALVPEIARRLRFLEEVGLGYLTLNRPGPTLSGGELQRARLATYLGGGLLGVCYILDEPTIGLHPHDTDRLIHALRQLQGKGSTVVVVEHDAAMLRAADYLVDLGPGGGTQGGRLLAQGTVDEVIRDSASITGRYLDKASRERKRLEESTHTPVAYTPVADAPGSPSLRLRGVTHHNLKNVDVAIPLGRLVCLTGVSGSGKSSLARDVLLAAARRHLGLVAPTPGEHAEIEGLEHLDKVIEVDQRPLGRSSRSTPASYVGILDELRKVFAATRTAKARGYKPNRFSFNVKGGRCETCQGQGTLRVTLKLLPQLRIPCPVCHGKRYNPATLEAAYRGKSIADVLNLTVADALAFFANVPTLEKPLAVLAEVGLGYLTLGQPSRTLSGGEAQRVKLSAELARTSTGRTLYLLDEPTTGLHFVDVARLTALLRRLVDAGNTVLVIEHNLDLIAASDWLIDLGPGGGEAGGNVVASGTPEEVARTAGSRTGFYLDAFFAGK